MTSQKTQLTYEQAKAALDDVVAKLEDKDLPLDDMVALWEQGEKFAAICEEKLSVAKAKLDALRPEVDED